MIWILIFTAIWTVRGQQGVPAVGAEYNDKSPDGSYRFGFQTGDTGGHYHSAIATKDNAVQGRFGSRDPSKGQIVETQYTSGKRGFRPRGPNIARKYDLSQNKIPYNPPVNPNAPNYNPTLEGYHDPNEDPSYAFNFKTPTYTKNEAADSRGHVNGLYSFVDDAGERHDVSYEAGAKIGFNVKTPFPDSKVFTGTFYRGPPSKAGGKTVRGKTSIQQRNDGSYRFVSAGPDQRRTEVSDATGHRRGSYSYIDDKGQQRTVEYIAGPNIGYRIISKGLGVKFPTAAPFLPPRYPDVPSGFDPNFPTEFPPFPLDGDSSGGAGGVTSTSTPGSGGEGGGNFGDDLFGTGGSSGSDNGVSSGSGNNFGGGFGSGNSQGGFGGTGSNSGGFGSGSGNQPGGFGGSSGSGNQQGGFGSNSGNNNPGFGGSGGNSGGFDGTSDSGDKGGFGSNVGGFGGNQGGFGNKPGGNQGGFGSGSGGSGSNGGFGGSGQNPGGSDDFGNTSERPGSTTSGFFDGFPSTFPGSTTTGRPGGGYPSRPTTPGGFSPGTSTPDPFTGYPDGRPPYGSPTLTSSRPGYVPPTSSPPFGGAIASAFPEDDPSRPSRPLRPSLEDDFLQNNYKDLPKKFFNHPSYFKPKPRPGQRVDYPDRDDSTFLSSDKRFYSFPTGIAVRAHVQSLDILPFGSRIPSPGFALETGITHTSGR